MILAAFLAIFIGLLLGLLGGGGSILTVPVLVYVLDLSAKDAIVTSLIIVSITSAIAMASHARKGRVCWKTGLAFSITGIIGAYLGGRISAHIPDQILLLLFSIVMLVASFYMLRGGHSVNVVETSDERLCPENLPLLAIFFDGFMVGGITGLVGVGGGFLLVPALSFLVRMPIHSAIGTSLLIITLQSLSALAGHAGHIQIDRVVIMFAVLMIIGSLIGSYLSSRISAKDLKTVFGYFVLMVACFMIYKDINQQMIDTVSQLYEEHKEFVLGVLSMLGLFVIYRLRVWIHAKAQL